MNQQIPLNYEASAGNTNMRITSELPPEVVQCLENARFLHLATCVDNMPHVSLMNYTYLPSSPYSDSPVIVMTTNPASKKMNNLVANPNVSLLVHDCKPPFIPYAFPSPHPPSPIIATFTNVKKRGLPPPLHLPPTPSLRRFSRPRTSLLLSRRFTVQPQHQRRLLHQRHHQRLRPAGRPWLRRGEILPREAPGEQHV